MQATGLKRLVLVAGGTGGRIFPAIGLGQCLSSQMPDLEVSYVSGSRPLELEIYGNAGIEPVFLPCEGSPLGTGGVRAVTRWIQVLRSVRAMTRFFGETKPDACVLFGGYVSFPALVAGRIKRVRTLVHEQNAVAGKVTRLASRLGIVPLTGWEACEPFSKGQFEEIGVPVRPMKRLPRREAWNKLGLGGLPDGKICLVLGGSLGSSALAGKVVEISRLPEFTGWSFLVMGKEMGDNHPSDRVWGIPRRWDMGPLYSLADVAVARGGASTLSELRAWAIPALVVPWPESRDDHQAANARLFEESGCGLVWDEMRGSGGELVARLIQLGKKSDAEDGISVDPGIAADRTSQVFLGKILRTLEGGDGNWMD